MAFPPSAPSTNSFFDQTLKWADPLQKVPERINIFKAREQSFQPLYHTIGSIPVINHSFTTNHHYHHYGDRKKEKKDSNILIGLISSIALIVGSFFLTLNFKSLFKIKEAMECCWQEMFQTNNPPYAHLILSQRHEALKIEKSQAEAQAITIGTLCIGLILVVSAVFLGSTWMMPLGFAITLGGALFGSIALAWHWDDQDKINEIKENIKGLYRTHIHQTRDFSQTDPANLGDPELFQ